MPDFTGVTFANQTVTPADDALVRRALLGDGILTGCEFSYSGYTLTMRSGALIVCGRQIRHPSAQNWAVVGAKTGYARLVLDIDLTKSSTAQLFDQVTTSLEYASAEDGFTALTQENINVSGSHYQAALCVVSLGDAGITGIVEQMEQAEGSGGGNFKLVGGLTQPARPQEYTIWVESDLVRKKYVIAQSAPEDPETGLVWLLASDKAVLSDAKIFDGETWARVNAYFFLASGWLKFATIWDGTLLSGSNQYTAITGGWGRNANNAGSDNNGWAMYAKNAIDVSGFSKLNIKANFPDCVFYKVGLVSKSGGVTQYGDSSWVASSQYYTPDGHYSDKDIDVNIDVSSLSGKYYVNVMAFRYGVEYKIDNVSYVKLS